MQNLDGPVLFSGCGCYKHIHCTHFLQRVLPRESFPVLQS
jgi:hypothetical protein